MEANVADAVASGVSYSTYAGDDDSKPKIIFIYLFIYLFIYFLTRTSQQHNGRLLVVVYFSFISDAFRLFRRLLRGMNTTDIGQH